MLGDSAMLTIWLGFLIFSWIACAVVVTLWYKPEDIAKEIKKEIKK